MRIAAELDRSGNGHADCAKQNLLDGDLCIMSRPAKLGSQCSEDFCVHLVTSDDDIF